MLKPVFQFVLLAISFSAMWFGLSKIDWVTLFKVEEKSQDIEDKLGEVYWDILKNVNDEITDKKTVGLVDSLITRICNRNDIDRDKIKLHLVGENEVNAFALPGDHIVVFSGLIDECENESELCGVLAHELAHLEKGHIMDKLIKEIGLSVLISMTSGSGSPEMIKQAIHVLSSSAYDRKLESEADLTGAEYLINAGIDPEAFATLMFRMAQREKDLPDELFWVTSHPGSEDRTKAILEYVEGRDFVEEPILDSLEWSTLKENTIE